MGCCGRGATRDPFISCHQLSVNHCNYHQLERAHQKAAGRYTRARSHSHKLQIAYQKPTHTHICGDTHADSNGTHWHLRMSIITSSAHQSQVLFRCMLFDHRLLRVHTLTHTHYTICVYNLYYSNALKFYTCIGGNKCIFQAQCATLNF